MISVCVATFNGEAYVGDQLQSILSSPLISEVIVSDDGSTDKTIEKVRAINDSRIKLIHGPQKGLIRNFEFLLLHAQGEYIFLADQDDLWLPNKVEVMMSYLQKADLVVCDCLVVDAQLKVLQTSFFQARNSGAGIVRNVLRNSYLGCCMALRKSLLKQALPFPPNLPMHDWWLGLLAEITGKVAFVDQPLMMYRRHGANASPTTERSRVGWLKRLNWRTNLVVALMRRKFGIK